MNIVGKRLLKTIYIAFVWLSISFQTGCLNLTCCAELEAWDSLMLWAKDSAGQTG